MLCGGCFQSTMVMAAAGYASRQAVAVWFNILRWVPDLVALPKDACVFTVTVACAVCNITWHAYPTLHTVHAAADGLNGDFAPGLTLCVSGVVCLAAGGVHCSPQPKVQATMQHCMAEELVPCN